MGEETYYTSISTPMLSTCNECSKKEQLCSIVRVEIPCNLDENRIICFACLSKLKGLGRADVLIRVDDGMRFLKNDDGDTYTREGQKETMPTTYYKYTYEELLETGAFQEEV